MLYTYRQKNIKKKAYFLLKKISELIQKKIYRSTPHVEISEICVS